MKLPALRLVPYPYRGYLVISSDIDGTRTASKFKQIQQFMRQEIGIPFSNTFFPYAGDKSFSLLSGSASDRDIILEHIRNGQIDAIHSFGDLPQFTRADARKAIEALEKAGCRLAVWIDHAEATSNFCKYRFRGQGDNPKAREYHIDILKQYGIRFIWTERLTNVVGQGLPLKLRDLARIYDPACPRSSATQLTKTALKVALSYAGSRKYNFFWRNTPLFPARMLDGMMIYEFVRFNNHFKGAAVGDTFEDLYYCISPRVVARLKARMGICIVYTHLGKKFSPKAEKTVAALRQLKTESDRRQLKLGNLYELLTYLAILKCLDWNFKQGHDGCGVIEIRSVKDEVSGNRVPQPQELVGVTFYVAGSTRVFLGEKELEVTHNAPDETLQSSVSIAGGYRAK